MLLLITGSLDGTADRIIGELGDNVFRLNYDLYRDYKISYSPDGWKIESPSGRVISSETATRAFWWKAFAYHLADDRLIKAEVKYIYKDLYGWFSTRGKARGTSIDFHNEWGKINILSRAKAYFEIPASLATMRLSGASDLPKRPMVAKSLSSEPSNDKTVLMTTHIELSSLDDKYPWFLQEFIKSDWDVTVFMCGNNLFPFKRSRKELKGIDWRAEQDFHFKKQEWFPFELQEKEKTSFLLLAKDMNVEVGRFDLMTREGGDDLIFLEFNANGQWVFLDINNQYGLVKCVTEWLMN